MLVRVGMCLKNGQTDAVKGVGRLAAEGSLARRCGKKLRCAPDATLNARARPHYTPAVFLASFLLNQFRDCSGVSGLRQINECRVLLAPRQDTSRAEMIGYGLVTRSRMRLPGDEAIGAFSCAWRSGGVLTSTVMPLVVQASAVRLPVISTQ